jgi:hypothetical protein
MLRFDYTGGADCIRVDRRLDYAMRSLIEQSATNEIGHEFSFIDRQTAADPH